MLLYVCQWRRCPTGLTDDVLTFFRRQHRVVLGTAVSLLHMKSFLLVRPRLFTASHLICYGEYWETTIKWPLLALLHSFRFFFPQFENIFQLFLRSGQVTFAIHNYTIMKSLVNNLEH